MSKKYLSSYKFIIVFVFTVIVFSACSEDPNSTGLNIIPGSDISVVGKSVEKDAIQAFTFTDGPLKSDETEFNLLGTFNDPVFGKTITDFAHQFRISTFPDFSLTPQADSLVLYLSYKEVFGDTLTTQSLKVYELVEDIFLDTIGVDGASNYDYYQDVDLKALSSLVSVGELDFVPKFQLDSTGVDTITQELVIKLDNSLADKLIQADSLDLVNNDAFKEFFKGLYIETQDIDEGGSILGIFNSHITLYYQNTLEGSEEDSLSYSYSVNTNSARVNRYAHDYSSTDFYTNLDQEVNEDSLIYIQTLGGLRTKVNLPNLDTWKDSSNIIINKAELIFHVDTVASDLDQYQLPSIIFLKALDENGDDYFPIDFLTYNAIYGGSYVDTDATYSFNITSHLQQIINGDKQNFGFLLYPTYSNFLYRRVVLKGSTSEIGIRFEVTYTKVN